MSTQVIIDTGFREDISKAPCSSPDVSLDPNTEKLLEIFRSVDGDNDGRITKEEFAEVLQRLDPKTWSQSSAELLFVAVDTDGSGDVDVQEFLSWVFDKGSSPKAATETVEAVPEALDEAQMEKLRKVFATVDSDDDGHITQTEFALILSFMDPTGWDNASIKQLFRAADADGSGDLDIEEFLDWVLHGKPTGSGEHLYDDESEHEDDAHEDGHASKQPRLRKYRTWGGRPHTAQVHASHGHKKHKPHAANASCNLRSEPSSPSSSSHVVEEPPTSKDEMYELLTMHNGKVGNNLTLDDMATLFYESKIDGLGQNLSQWVPQHVDVAIEPVDVSIPELVHLYQMLWDNHEATLEDAVSTIRGVREDMDVTSVDVSSRISRQHAIEHLGVDVHAPIKLGLFRRLVELLSVLMQIDEAHILASFAWVRTTRFEMTEAMGIALMEHVFCKVSHEDLHVLQHPLSDNDFVRMCHNMKLIDNSERKGLHHGKLALHFGNILKHMPGLLDERAHKRYTDRGKPFQRGKHQKITNRRIRGLTQMSVLMEELYKLLPLNRATWGSPLRLVLQFIEVSHAQHEATRPAHSHSHSGSSHPQSPSHQRKNFSKKSKASKSHEQLR